ncbi:hypothetical protein [Sphingobium ummariense]|uniref:Uncharacterized protein n=1 Tax=Sphingobium ummariense RL-3 TaxID=1346791 RepID=T0K5M4_9SPHN|nr:hypothetical protein [Sphingobium ummariense]EQB31974.1 hypothetical protein M529_11980 [Sphingobium ummariense RL-3]
MRAASPKKRGLRSWRRVDVTPDNMEMVGAKLRECGTMGGEGEPVQAHAHFDRQGRLRRIHAAYENGWRVTINIRLDGSYSLSQAIKIVSKPKGHMPA